MGSYNCPRIFHRHGVPVFSYKVLIPHVSSMRDMYDVNEKNHDSNQQRKDIKIEFSGRKNENVWMMKQVEVTVNLIII